MAACSDNILIMWDSLISVYRMWRFSLDSMLSPCWSVWTLGPPSRLSAVSAALSRPALCKHFSVMGVGPASSPWPLTPLQTPLPSEGPTKGSSTWRRLRTAALLHIVSDSGVLRLVVSLSFCVSACWLRAESLELFQQKIIKSQTDELRDTYYTSVTVCTVGLVSVHILVFLTRVNQKLTTSPKVQMYWTKTESRFKSHSLFVWIFLFVYK